MAATNDDTKYALGSVLNHVLLHQTIVGQEAMLQLEMAGDDPDVIVGCTGGGSNFAGISFPFIGQQLRGGARQQRRIVAVEPAACPSLTRGKFAYDFGDTAHLTPLTKMHTLGSTFTPPGFHAGGLRYHGMAPLVSHLKELNLIEATAYHQTACFEAGVMFARAEGIVPAPEANHAVKGAIVEALRCKAEGRSEVILFNLCGHGHFDMSAYSAYFAGKLVDQHLRRGRAGDGPVGAAVRAGLNEQELLTHDRRHRPPARVDPGRALCGAGRRPRAARQRRPVGRLRLDRRPGGCGDGSGAPCRSGGAACRRTFRRDPAGAGGDGDRARADRIHHAR